MVFKKMIIEGFRSFRKQQTLTFPKLPGFYFLTGENQVDPKLGPNAIGKSTIWDALSWVMFGRTARGQRGPSVVNWEGASMCSVELHGVHAGRSFVLMRTQDPNSLTLAFSGEEPETVTQEDIDSWLKMNHAMFMSLVLMGQFNRFFFDLSPTEKLKIFSDALQLDVWLEASAKATEEKKELSDEAQRIEVKLSSIRGKIKVMADQIAVTQEQKEKFDKEQAELVAMHEEKVTEAEGEKQKWQARYDEAKRDFDKCKRSYEEVNSALMEVDADLQAREKDIIQAKNDVRMIDTTIARLKKEREQIEECEGHCPFCHQQVDQQHVDDECQRYDKAIRAEKKKKKTAQGKLEGLEESLAELREQHKEAGKACTAASQALQNVQGKLGKTKTEAGLAGGSLKLAQQQLKDARSRKNPHAAQLKKIKQDRKKKIELRNKLKTKGADNAKRLQAVAYWAKGFKDIRLWLIREALNQLTIEVNNVLIQLGLQGWTIEFDVERENRSGGISRGFSVLINAPGGGSQVPWESWSGGETQRLRVAGAIGLANLIASRLGYRPSIEVWDEPTAFLSEEGINQLLTFLRDRATSEDRQIWLVDHRSLSYGFDRTVRVVKTEAGTRIEK